MQANIGQRRPLTAAVRYVGLRKIAPVCVTLGLFLLVACAGSHAPAMADSSASSDHNTGIDTRSYPGQTPEGLALRVNSVEAPIDVLFIGNSFTYYNNSLHNHFRQLVRAGKPPGVGKQRVRAMTLSGARLVEHDAAFKAMVDSHEWDMVVMQGHSRGPISKDTAQSFRETARKFDDYLDRQNIQSALFMTWAYTDAPEMTQKLARSYIETANEIEALVVPVGLAFAHATEWLPDIALRTSDKRHPSLAGSYLAACVFYASLYRQRSVGITYSAGLDPQVATKLQEVADTTVSAFFGRELP